MPRVLVLTLSAPRDYIAGNNAMLVALPAQFPNVELLYWDGLAGQCPDNCFYEDGIHLRQTGQDYYTQLIAGQLGHLRLEPERIRRRSDLGLRSAP